MAAEEPKTVKLKTSDDQDRDVPYAIAKMNQTIATMIDGVSPSALAFFRALTL